MGKVLMTALLKWQSFDVPAHRVQQPLLGRTRHRLSASWHEVHRAEPRKRVPSATFSTPGGFVSSSLIVFTSGPESHDNLLTEDADPDVNNKHCMFIVRPVYLLRETGIWAKKKRNGLNCMLEGIIVCSTANEGGGRRKTPHREPRSARCVG